VAVEKVYLDSDIVGVVLSSVKLNELQNPDGNVEFNKKQALQLVAENRTDDPSAPAGGQIWLRTDL